MNVTKKLDRMKQWAGEKMGNEAKTSTSEEFKALEAEMNLRHDGMERLQRSMTAYVKSISSRNVGEDRDKLLPISYMGQQMVGHGQDFDHDSDFGNCLVAMGRANENLARKQEAYVAHSTTTWLESLERSLAQMKEYQAARKKLDQRRLAYDASLAKMQKAKKEDFRVEEELRSQKAKYEETNEDVFRRMQDIKEAESESVSDLTAFLDSELAYYENCADILRKLKRDWPGASAGGAGAQSRNGRSRSNTAQSYTDRFSRVDERPEEDEGPRPAIPARLPSREQSYDRLGANTRPIYPRANTTSADSARDYSPARMARIPTDPTAMLAGRPKLRPVARDGFLDEDQDTSSPDRYFNERSDSPTTSYGSGSRSASWTNMDAGSVGSIKKAPPPPPPSRARKPAPPPPPMKRSALSTSQIPQSPH